jgi:TetR/AcrR family transcriptional repressor of bet genes
MSSVRRMRSRKPSRISEERRGDLIQAAISAISQVGYGNVTVQTIGEEAGFSRGLVGHYFEGKDALLLEAVKHVAKKLGDATRAAAREAGPDPLARLHAVVRASFNPPGFTEEHVAVWTALAGSARWSRPLGAIYRELWRDYRQAIARLMSRCAAERKLAINVERSALAFSQLIEGLWIGCACDPLAVSPEEGEAACREFLDRLLGPATSRGR